MLTPTPTAAAYATDPGFCFGLLALAALIYILISVFQLERIDYDQ